jgi:hypothetical protein
MDFNLGGYDGTSADAIPVDLSNTNLNSGGGSALPIDGTQYGPQLPTGYDPLLSNGGLYDPNTGPPPTKPDVPTTTTSWTGSALDGIGKAGSAAWNWITSPFASSIDNRTTPAIGGPGSRTQQQSGWLSSFGTGSPASSPRPMSALSGSGATSNNLLLYGAMAFLAIALLKRR